MINEKTDRIILKRFNKNHCDFNHLDSDPNKMKYITLDVPGINYFFK